MTDRGEDDVYIKLRQGAYKVYTTFRANVRATLLGYYEYAPVKSFYQSVGDQVKLGYRLAYEVETAIASTKPRVQFTHLRFFYVRKRSTVNYAVF